MQGPALKECSFEFEGLDVAYYRGGKGAPLLMIHGSGPGASSIGNWRTVMGPLSERYEIFAMDLVGFGKSARKPAAPYFDFPQWVRQARAMLDLIDGEKVGVIGHSISGAIALHLAASSSRVAGVLTTGTMGAPFTATDATRRCWTCPTNREALVLALSGLIYDKSVIDEAYLAAREPVVFAPGYADYFNAMFTGDPQQYIGAAVLDDATLSRITCPVSLLHGRDDVAFPDTSSVSIASKLVNGDLTLLSKCSHSVAFERTDVFLALAERLFGGVLVRA